MADEGFSQNVADLVRIATLASRNKMGELIWFGWCSKSSKKKSLIGHGSHGIMLTKTGAMAVHDAMTSGRVPRGDIDLVLLPWLREENVARTVGACYIYPSLGSFWEHVSGCGPVTYGGRSRRAPFWLRQGRPSSRDEGCHCSEEAPTRHESVAAPQRRARVDSFSEREGVA